MPVTRVLGYLMVTFDFRYKEIYWKQVSEIVKSEFGTDEIRDNILVQRTLKKCFTYFGECFDRIIKKENRASFYIFVHNFHENSIELWNMLIRREKIPYDESDLAIIRRILKIILEQGCGNELKNSIHFGEELYENRSEYLKTLEELLYIGYQAISLSDQIAKSQLFPKSIGFQVIDDKLTVLTYPLYNSLFDFINSEIPKHDDNIVVYVDAVYQFKKILNDKIGLRYESVISFLNIFDEHPKYNFALLNPMDVIKEISQHYKYDETNLRNFYAGLTVSKSNKLNFEDCILRNQDINRYLYRPILELDIEGKSYWLIGQKKWVESLSTLITNGLTFGFCPNEWLKFKPMKDFIEHLRLTHDRVLENPIVDILREKNFKHDNNVTSIYANGDYKNQIRIDTKGVGEIDIIFLDEEFKIIYICECKHNRSRFDLFNWRRDYHNFVHTYEDKLKNKTDWVSNNIEAIENHFKVLYNYIDLSDYIVRGIFIINAPTIYMFNGNFRALTITDFKNLVNRKYEDITLLLKNEVTKKEIIIKYPYFKSIEKIE